MFALMSILLIFAAVGVAALGWLFLSEATTGVGLIATGCLFAIIARIAQAASYHEDSAPAVSYPAQNLTPAQQANLRRTSANYLLYVIAIVALVISVAMLLQRFV